MAISVEGVRFNVTVEALQPGEGFVVRFNANMNQDDNEERNAARKAQEMDILGTRLNSHEVDFGIVETVIATEISSFAANISQFITDWNNGDIEGSPNYTPPQP